MRITGKLLKDDLGRRFACRECMNTKHTDSCIKIEAIDCVYHKPIYKIKDQIEEDKIEVVRDLNDSKPLEQPKTFIDDEVQE